MTKLTTYTRRDPFTSDPWSQFDSLVRTAFGPAGTSTSTARRLDFTPAAETVRDGDDVVVRLELPGVDVASDVTVEVVANRLVVKGERRDERTVSEGESGEDARRISEIRYGSFERSFGLPSHVGADAVSASYDAGVLSVRVAGVYAGTEPTRIEISQG